MINGEIRDPGPYTVGTVVNLVCNPGFTISGLSRISCSLVDNVPQWRPQISRYVCNPEGL